MKKPVIIGMNSSNSGEALDPFVANGSGERLWKMVNEHCGCTKEDYVSRFEMMNLLDHEWDAKKAAESAGRLRFNLSGRQCYILGREVWKAMALPREAPWFSSERSYVGSRYVLLPHPSGLNVLYNEKSVRKKAGKLLARAGGWHMT